MPTKSVILYSRVSTKEQGKSGLGLAAQIEEMRAYAAQNNLIIVDTRQEVVSGKYQLDRRPVLKQAFADASRVNNCYVLTSKLDRLSRDTAFICDLIKRDVKFLTVETGIDCSPLLLQIRASVAEEERRKGAGRTKQVCNIKRQNGVPMGMNIPSMRVHKERAQALSSAAIKTEADAFADFMRPTIQRMRDAKMSVNAIADELNLHEFKTQRGGKWYAKSVCNLMARWQTA